MINHINNSGKKIDDFPWPDIIQDSDNVSNFLEYHLNSTIDATVWAEEFLKVVWNKPIDRDMMIGWFANAIMSGYDEARRRYQENK